MITKKDIQPEKTQISDLTNHEINWILSLSLYDNPLPEQKIADLLNVTGSVVRKVIEDYLESQRLQQESKSKQAKKKPRKRRSDSKYASPADRQTAYRARLKEKSNTDM